MRSMISSAASSVTLGESSMPMVQELADPEESNNQRARGTQGEGEHSTAPAAAKPVRTEPSGARVRAEPAAQGADLSPPRGHRSDPGPSPSGLWPPRNRCQRHVMSYSPVTHLSLFWTGLRLPGPAVMGRGWGVDSRCYTEPCASQTASDALQKCPETFATFQLSISGCMCLVVCQLTLTALSVK